MKNDISEIYRDFFKAIKMSDNENKINLDRKERGLIGIALEVYKWDLEDRLKNEKLSETGKNILKSNYCMVKELELKFKEW